MQNGALPELFSLTTQEAKRNYVSSVKDTIFLKEIPPRK
jgi:hypothetical protein